MSEDAKLDKLMNMMESMMVSIGREFQKLDNKIESLRTEMKIELEEMNKKIDVALETVVKTSNHELEKRVTELEKKLA